MGELWADFAEGQGAPYANSVLPILGRLFKNGGSYFLSAVVGFGIYTNTDYHVDRGFKKAGQVNVTFDGTPNSGLYVRNSFWGLSDNGDWDAAKTTFIGSNSARPGSIRISFNDAPVSSVGGFMNHAPIDSETMVINAYDAGMNLLESYDITADAVTPDGVNAGVFRGISRPSADIAYFEVFGGVPVMDDLTFNSDVQPPPPPPPPAVPVPVDSNWALLLLTLSLMLIGGLMLRRDL